MPSSSSTKTAARAGFTQSQLAELLALIKDSDSVELKLTVPEETHRSTVASLGMDPLDAQIRQVFFFDTPDLALDQAGVVVRARRIQGKGEDSVVKLRPVVPAELPAELRLSGGFRVEVDALPGGFVCSGTMKGALRPGNVKSALAGERPFRKLFSKEQRAFYAEHAPEGMGLDDLSDARADLRPQARIHAGGSSTAGSWPRCGCTRTARACSSSRRGASRPRRSTSRPSCGSSSPSTASTSPASSRRRRARRSSTSPRRAKESG